MTTWTKELPKESGFYWYRDNGRYEIVEFDDAEKIIMFCGDEIGLGGYWSEEIESEFWPVRLLPPDEARAPNPPTE